MNAGRAWRVGLGTIGACLVTAAVAPPAARAAPTTIAVIAKPGSRLADDLKREIEASRFVVVSIDARARDWRDDVAARLPAGILHGVVVSADEQGMTVFSRPTTAGAVEAPFQQKVEADDRLARRRACLSVVEYLRVLAETDLPAPIDPGPLPPTARAPPASMPRALAQTAAEEAPGPAGEPPYARPSAWEIGAGTSLELESAPGGPMGHLQFLWFVPLEPPFAICIRTLWPLLGARFRTDGNDVRTWALGASASIQYLLGAPRARLQPFAGVELGARLALTETTSMDALQSEETVTPSLELGVEAGLRYLLGPGLRIFVALEGVRDWLVPGLDRSGYEEEAANGESVRASAGALFGF